VTLPQPASNRPLIRTDLLSIKTLSKSAKNRQNSPIPRHLLPGHMLFQAAVLVSVAFDFANSK
jgi:hypothetical protein